MYADDVDKLELNFLSESLRITQCIEGQNIIVVFKFCDVVSPDHLYYCGEKRRTMTRTEKDVLLHILTNALKFLFQRYARLLQYVLPPESRQL